MHLAHISEDKQREQSLKEHLCETARLAAGFAAVFDCEDWGFGCGMLHDIGKYSGLFQEHIRGKAVMVDHSTAGAQELYLRKNILGAYCIAGHHSGLPDGGVPGDPGHEATLCGRMKKNLENYNNYQTETEIPAFSNPPIRCLGKGGFTLSFFVRMLFSCLVDADYLDTERFMTGSDSIRGGFDSMMVLREHLQQHVSQWLAEENPTTVNGRRTSILKTCMKKGKDKQGLFQLTVPTGGGKTVSSLAFALEHAAEHNLQRIIYVIPYTSIIEQNAQVFRDILGDRNVLEDHCNVVYESETELQSGQLAAENWDRPVVVTTNVQFFESLFANKTSKCRKLHNIAGSVIIFDEAQMLPVKYLKPCTQVISELVYNYHCTAVMCTATQPSLSRFFTEQLSACEICPDVQEQYEFFRRTIIRKGGVFTEEDLSESLKKRSRVLCILNSRKRVQKIYEALPEEGRYHLSTFMYPKHRKRVLQAIRDRLDAKEICRVVSTSLVEAGVDLDFDTVFREMAGLDSVIQAAGRCNREGNNSLQDSETIVFTMEKTRDISVSPALKLPIAVGRQVAEQLEDMASLEAIERYFSNLYYYKGEGLDAKKIVEQFDDAVRSKLFPFALVAKQFRLIEEDTYTILICVEPEAAVIAQRIKWGEHSRQLVRDAGIYCVNVYENDFEALNGAGLLEALPLGFYILRNLDIYTEEKGLCIEVERGEALFL